MPPADDEQRRHEMAARFETLRLQPPPPPTAQTLNNYNLVPFSTDNIDIVDDVLMEILLRLPAKSLIRFKSVCKNWLSLISTDQFCHRHTLQQHKLQPSSFILETYNGQFFYFNPNLTINSIAKKMVPYIPALPALPYLKIYQECNGLLLLESKIKTSYDATKLSQIHLKRSYCVYNPTTRRSREITLAYNDKYPHVVLINIVFDPSKSPYYKIVCIRCNGVLDDKANIYQGEVYDSERHTWKLGSDTFTSIQCFTHLEFDGVYWNNAIYWRIYDDGRDCYYYFDIENNQFKTMPSYFLLQKSRNECHIYGFKLVDKEEDEDEDEDGPKKHYHIICTRPYQGVKTGTTIVRFMEGGGDGGGDRDAACGLLTCRAGIGKRPYIMLDKYENLVDLRSAWYYPAEAYPFAETLALV